MLPAKLQIFSDQSDWSFSGFFLPPFRDLAERIVLNRALFWTGGLFLVEGVLMLVYADWAARHRDRMLNMVSWRGDEQVLDFWHWARASCHWSSHAPDHRQSHWRRHLERQILPALARNGRDRLRRKGSGESRLAQRMMRRRLGFADDTFDIVVSNLCIHNIPGRSGASKPARKLPGCSSRVNGSHLRFQEYRRLSEYLAGAGLRVSRTWFSLDFPRCGSSRPSRLGIR